MGKQNFHLKIKVFNIKGKKITWTMFTIEWKQKILFELFTWSWCNEMDKADFN